MKNGRNALQIASRNGSLELCRILIEKGADIESRSQVGKLFIRQI
jgi:ankyrin repeat protein